MGLSKTKEMLIDVARRLFAESGKDHATMNDIAIESKKDRRTIYTYFNNKEDIYLAVIQRELEYLIKRLEAVEQMSLPPDEKLKEYIFIRLDAFCEVIDRNGSLQAAFFQDTAAVDKAHLKIDAVEIQILKHILDDGKQKGIFAVEDTKWTAEILMNIFKGLEKPYYRPKFHARMQSHRDQFTDLILNSILNRKNPNV